MKNNDELIFLVWIVPILLCGSWRETRNAKARLVFTPLCYCLALSASRSMNREDEQRSQDANVLPLSPPNTAPVHTTDIPPPTPDSSSKTNKRISQWQNMAHTALLKTWWSKHNTKISSVRDLHLEIPTFSLHAIAHIYSIKLVWRTGRNPFQYSLL